MREPPSCKIRYGTRVSVTIYIGGGLMVDYREILRLHYLGDSHRSITLKVQSSKNTVSAVIAAAKAAGVSWSLGDNVTNEDISEVLFPKEVCLCFSLHYAGFRMDSS